MNPTAKQSLQALFSALPTADSADPGQTAQCFMLAIEGIPDQFIAVAAKRYIQGRVVRKSHSFLPSAPEFAIEARRGWVEAQCAALPPKALPPPEKPRSAEDREKVATMLAGLAEQITKPNSVNAKPNSVSLEDELAALASQPIRVSEAFFNKINKANERAS